MDLDFKKLRYDIDQVLNHFSIERNISCPLIESWLTVIIPSSFIIPQLLEQQRVRLEYEGDLWNEEELKMHFLSILFLFSEMEVPKKMKLFYERTLSAVVQSTKITVKCDALLAAPLGVNTPQNPYFFLQEFKKGKKSSDDAEGQMLLAMLIAQEKNGDNKPIYGSYLLGKDWYFTTLHGSNYCFSKSYDATIPSELSTILFALRKLKEIVL